MQYEQFLDIVIALLKLVIISMILERGLAFVFEHDWVARLLTHEIEDPDDPSRKIRTGKVPGLKGLLAFAAAAIICFSYRFDVLAPIFARDSVDNLGILITSFVVAGGSAGAIAIFQGFLSLSKQTRDAMIAAKQAEAEATRKIAQQNVLAAQARKERAEAVKKIADANVSTAEARKQRVDAMSQAAQQAVQRRIAAAEARKGLVEQNIEAAKARAQIAKDETKLVELRIAIATAERERVELERDEARKRRESTPSRKKAAKKRSDRT